MFLSQNIETDKLSEDVLTVIEAPRQSDLMIELIKKLKPQVVVTGMAHFEAITSSAFQHLLDTTREIGSRIFLDISDHFELSSLPPSNGVLKYLAGTPLPPHAAIICGLLKNQVFPSHFDQLWYLGLFTVGSFRCDQRIQRLITMLIVVVKISLNRFTQIWK